VINYHPLVIIAQYIIFAISIYFFDAILKLLKFSSRLSFVGLLIYAVHPAFMFHCNILTAESLALSLSTLFIYHLIRYVKSGSRKECCWFHFFLIILVFLKPVFLFLFGLSVLLFLYQALKKNVQSLKIYAISFLLSVSSVGIYVVLMHHQYGVYGICGVSDLNQYWILKQNKLIDFSSIQNQEIKNHILENYDISYENGWDYGWEASIFVSKYGWKETHSIVQNSLKKNFKSFLLGEEITKRRIEAFHESVGFTTDSDLFGKLKHSSPIVYHSFTFFTVYHLLILLVLYGCMIVYYTLKKRKMPVISALFLSYLLCNLFVMIFSAPIFISPNYFSIKN
jgi:hypothetical protein